MKEVLIVWEGHNERSEGSVVETDEQIVLTLNTKPSWADLPDIIEQLKGIDNCSENNEMHEACRSVLNGQIKKLESILTS